MASQTVTSHSPVVVFRCIGRQNRSELRCGRCTLRVHRPGAVSQSPIRTLVTHSPIIHREWKRELPANADSAKIEAVVATGVRLLEHHGRLTTAVQPGPLITRFHTHFLKESWNAASEEEAVVSASQAQRASLRPIFWKMRTWDVIRLRAGARRSGSSLQRGGPGRDRR
jgi:hypothetical protein